MILNEIEKGLWKGESVLVYTRFGYSIIDLDQFQFDAVRSEELEKPIIDEEPNLDSPVINKTDFNEKQGENIENIENADKLIS